MKKVIASTAVLLLVATVAWATAGGGSGSNNDCLTSADVLRHQAESRNGISLSCTEDGVEKLGR